MNGVDHLRVAYAGEQTLQVLRCRLWCIAQVLREIVTLERMHRAFESGLMEYGMAKAVKKAQPAGSATKRVPFFANA